MRFMSSVLLYIISKRSMLSCKLKIEKALMEDQQYISVQEAAKQLRVGVETVRRYIRSGAFNAAKVGRQYLIKPETVRALIDKQFAARKPTPAAGKSEK
jgi:excisionase family DNA binding protein